MVHWSRNRKQRIRLGYKDGIRVAFMKTPSARNKCIAAELRDTAPGSRDKAREEFTKAAKKCK
jgi:hypothetical protein